MRALRVIHVNACTASVQFGEDMYQSSRRELFIDHVGCQLTNADTSRYGHDFAFHRVEARHAWNIEKQRSVFAADFPGHQTPGVSLPIAGATMIREVIRPGWCTEAFQVARCGTYFQDDVTDATRYQVALGRIAGPEPDVDFRLDEIGELVGQHQVEAGPRIAILELAQQRRQEMRTERGGRRYPDEAIDFVAAAADLFQRIVQQAQARVRQFVQVLSFVRQRQAAGRAVEQAHAQIVLELSNGLADGLRSQAFRHGSLAETSRAYDADKQGNDPGFIHDIYNQRVKIKQPLCI